MSSSNALTPIQHSIQNILKRLEAIETAEAGTEWIDLPYTAGWEDYDASWGSGQYRKVGDKIEIRGMCKRSSGSSLVVATLPVGFRPSKNLLHVVIQSTNTAARMTILPTGAIQLTNATGSFSWLSLEMSFALD